MKDLVWMEISKNKLKNNISEIKKIIKKDTKLAVCVKSNAYSFGIVEISKTVIEAGADWLLVASAKEAFELRDAGLRVPILLMGYFSIDDTEQIALNGISVFVWDYDLAENISKEAEKKGLKIKVHIKIDTGMGRLGILPDKLEEFYLKIKELKGIEIEGICSHLANSDTEEQGFTKKQWEVFETSINTLNKKIPIKHLCNSAGSILNDKAHFDLVRIGLIAYGYYPSSKIKRTLEKRGIKLSPILDLKAKVIQIKELPEGAFIGYGSTYKTEKPTTVGIIPIGYSDGLDRGLSNKGSAIVRGKKVKIIGRISMNLTAIDLTGVGASLEDEVVLIGEQGKETITVEEISDLLDTIPYEVLSRLNQKIPRYYSE